MRRITLWIVSTVAVLVLLFSYRTSTSGPATPATAVVAPAAAPAGIVTDPAPSSSGSAKAQPSQAAKTVKVNGPAVDTRWGPVQVQVAIANGKIVQVTVLQRPSSNQRDDEINAYALPQLREQVLSAQSAQIDGVSGATVTSDGYRESLQQALDTAHFGS